MRFIFSAVSINITNLYTIRITDYFAANYVTILSSKFNLYESITPYLHLTVPRALLIPLLLESSLPTLKLLVKLLNHFDDCEKKYMEENY